MSASDDDIFGDGPDDDGPSLDDLGLTEQFLTHDGLEFGAGGEGLETTTLILHRGPLPSQFVGGTAVSAESTGQAVMAAVLGGNEAAGFPATASIGFAPNDGRLVLEVDGHITELQSFGLDRHEDPNAGFDADQQQFLLRMVDANQDTWFMHVVAQTPQIGELNGFMRALAQQAEMTVLQPTIWEENAADVPDLLAVRAETVSRVDVLPDPSGEGWAMVIEHHDDANHGYRFLRAADAIDAMDDVLQTLGRPVTKLDAHYADLEDGRLRQFGIDAKALEGKAETPELPAVESVHFSAILGSKPKVPNVVGGVVLEPDWIKFIRPPPSVSIANTRDVVEKMIYPGSRSDPHPFDLGTAPEEGTRPNLAR